jgi:hypothetical protein
LDITTSVNGKLEVEVIQLAGGRTCTLRRNGKTVIIQFSYCKCSDWYNASIPANLYPVIIARNTTLILSGGGTFAHFGLVAVTTVGDLSVAEYVPNSTTIHELNNRDDYLIFGELSYVIS